MARWRCQNCGREREESIRWNPPPFPHCPVCCSGPYLPMTAAEVTSQLTAHIATLEAELEKERFIDGADSRQDRLKGRLCVQGTRFPVWSLLGELAGGSSIEVIANNFSLDVDALAKVLWAMSQKYAQEPPHDA